MAQPSRGPAHPEIVRSSLDRYRADLLARRGLLGPAARRAMDLLLETIDAALDRPTTMTADEVQFTATSLTGVAPEELPAFVNEYTLGLRALHESLPVELCPFSWSTDDRVKDAKRRAALAAMDPSRWHPEHRALSVDQALELVAVMPPIDRLVVCHGDACAPNTLLTGDGFWSGHVDLGALGIGDRWADLAVATWSTEWNYGPGWEARLLAAYGVAPDAHRTQFYRLLWDLGP